MCSRGFLWKTRLSRVSLGALKAENMLEVLDNGQEGGQRQVRAKVVLAVFRSRFPKRGIDGLSKLGVNCVPVDFFGPC